MQEGILPSPVCDHYVALWPIDPSSLLTAERFAYLTIVALANRLNKVWISKNSILFFPYLLHYCPNIVPVLVAHSISSVSDTSTLVPVSVVHRISSVSATSTLVPVLVSSIYQ